MTIKSFRAEIFRLLSQEPLSAAALARRHGLPRDAVNNAYDGLARRGLIELVERRGRECVYRVVADDPVWKDDPRSASRANLRLGTVAAKAERRGMRQPGDLADGYGAGACLLAEVWR